MFGTILHIDIVKFESNMYINRAIKFVKKFNTNYQ